MNIEFVSYPPIAGEVLRDHFWELAEHPRNPRAMLLEAYRTRRAQAIRRKWEAAARGDAFGSLLHALEASAWLKMTDSL